MKCRLNWGDMPLYEYRCQKCGGTFETIQKFSDEPLTVHEGCGGEVERVLSAPALQFKGSGWYVNDYGRGNGKSPSSSSSSNGSSEAKKETSGSKPATESKPSPAPATKSE
jgi:putative FmdB family regulatory protein